MSRVGKTPIEVPPQAQVEVQGDVVRVEGPKGKMTHRLPPGFVLERSEGFLHLKRSADDKTAKSLHGLHKTLITHMIQGVLRGFSKELELNGVGYRAQVSGKKLDMFVGFTHPVIFEAPEGITLEAPKPTQIIVRGTDKQLVGQVAARIRAYAPPEPYKGKGIRYAGEVIRRKAGKAVA